LAKAYYWAKAGEIKIPEDCDTIWDFVRIKLEKFLG
jgi:hypothetical protein